jgi:hypothetical protein
MILVMACGWQRIRPATALQSIAQSGGPVFSSDEFAAIRTGKVDLWTLRGAGLAEPAPRVARESSAKDHERPRAL